MGQLSLGNKTITYEERHSLRAIRLSITVAKGKVQVTIPAGASQEQVSRFLEAKKPWIFKHMERHEIRESIPQRSFVEGERLPYMGRELLLQTQGQPGKYTTIKLEEHNICVYLAEDIPKSTWEEVVRDAVIFTYQQQAKKIFAMKLDYYAKIMGLKYNQLRIKEQRTKWGSCSRQGNINLNWRVIMAPEEVIDYLILHELAHLKHMNHSKEYWHYVASFMSDYKTWQKWLKEKGRSLII